jgi:hypothetical protein
MNTITAFSVVMNSRCGFRPGGACLVEVMGPVSLVQCGPGGARHGLYRYIFLTTTIVKRYTVRSLIPAAGRGIVGL